MAGLTIAQAKRLLGKEVEGLTDEEIQEEIDIATLLKDLFFEGSSKLNRSRPDHTNVP